LRSQQQHLAMAQRLAHLGSFERDLTKGTVIWSAETYRILGQDEASAPLSREGFLAQVHPEDRSRYEAAMVASEQGQAPDPITFRITRPDGTVRWLHSVSETVFDEAGDPVRRIGTYQDITARQEAQARERQRDARLLEMSEEIDRGKEHLALAQRIAK